MKAIQTEYKGYLFRSRLEARWAVFFDACGVRWEYEPEGYDLGDGIYYLPDFLLHGVDGRDGGDLYVEVKGNMTPADAEKILRFIERGGREGKYGKYKNATLVVGNIPEGETADEIDWYVSDHAYHGPAPYGMQLFLSSPAFGQAFPPQPAPRGRTSRHGSAVCGTASKRQRKLYGMRS